MSAIHWVESFEDASRTAADCGKLMLIYFHTNQCYWCDELDQKTFADPTIIQLASELVCLKLNPKEEASALTIANQYGIGASSAYPTLIFADSGAKEIYRVVGYRPPKEFPGVIEQVLGDEKRLKALEHRISECSDELESNFQLAMLYLKRQNLDNATPLIQKVLGANLSKADQAHLQMNYGTALALAKRYSESLACFEAVIHLSTDQELVGQAQYCLGITHGVLGDFEQCRALLKACAEANADNSKWHQQEARRVLNCLGQPIPPGFSVPPVHSTSQSPRENLDRIAFVSQRDGHDEIYVMNADGSGQKRLTYHESQARYPAWSPDRTQIAFVSDWQLYVMNADGSEDRCLSDDLPGEVDGAVSWSPDGKWIAFGLITGRVSYKENLPGGGIREICVINVKDRSFFNLTKNMFHLDVQKWDSTPRWSPDGTQIRYNSGGNIYIMKSDGSDKTQLTHSGCDGTGNFSPDGQRIAFTSSRRGHFEIYLMDVDGQNVRQLTHSQGSAWPSWSLDGTKLVFYDAEMKIHVMHLDEGRIELLSSQNDALPSWSS
ncbi:PD40 domain-containing protein [Candidatus Poribacteria bacterium]|nr:PD40 domain-containing protein [Candidatus Poribacteria bacterium]